MRKYMHQVDEIWHAGDIGNLHVITEIRKIKPLRAVYGNIDGQEIREEYPEDLYFELEGVKVYMTHIGGYPGRYKPKVKQFIKKYPVDLFISGHSHILKVLYDEQHHLLHMNPGAAGKYGFHKVRTMLRFQLENGSIQKAEVIEMKR
jgi:putative phosphoesterase